MKRNAKLIIAALFFIALGAGCTTVHSLQLHEKYACAMVNRDEVYCWGDNTYGQLGDGTNQNSNMPVRVALKRQGAFQPKQQGWQIDGDAAPAPNKASQQNQGWQNASETPQKPTQPETSP
jgi:hypothetical protein